MEAAAGAQARGSERSLGTAISRRIHLTFVNFWGFGNTADAAIALPGRSYAAVFKEKGPFEVAPRPVFTEKARNCDVLRRSGTSVSQR